MQAERQSRVEAARKRLEAEKERLEEIYEQQVAEMVEMLDRPMTTEAADRYGDMLYDRDRLQEAIECLTDCLDMLKEVEEEW